MNWMTPFHFDFMLVAFGVGAFVAGVCAVFSCFLVLKGWSLMGDAISHAVLPGIVIAFVAGVPLVFGAFGAGLLCALSTGYVTANSRLKEDSVMGVIFTGMFAIGLILFTKVESDQHLNHILFGSLLGIPHDQVVQTFSIGGFALLLMLIFKRDLMLFCFDPNHAQSIGMSARWLQYLMLILLSLTIVAALQAVGVILVVSMLITPGCIGFLFADRFPTMLLLAVLAGVVSSFIGTYISFFMDASTSASIVLVLSVLFIVSLVFAPKKGILVNLYRRRTA